MPQEVADNATNYRKHNPDYNIVILADSDINVYNDCFPDLIQLFHKSSIAALKSDIIRMVFLYSIGGLWLDSNTTLIDDNGINILFEKYKQYDFVITILPNCNFDLKTSALLAKPGSKLAFDTINIMTENLVKHYNLEQNATKYIPYNFFKWVAPVVCYELLEYDFHNRSFVTEQFEKNKNCSTLDLPKFFYYNCGLMDVSKYLCFYGCNMTHHHGPNFNKHWSNLQKHQKLFTPLDN